MKAIVLAGSKGIGKGIADALEKIDFVEKVFTTSSKDLDTSKLSEVEEFVDNNKNTDILVLNTGGPPVKDFFEIRREEWELYFNQLFYSFVYILQKLYINDNGYIFLISSNQIKEPDSKMSLSVTYRLAFSGLLKLLSKDFAKRGISCINIAPGNIGTKRLENLVEDMESFEATLPLGRVGTIEEISIFIKSIVQHKIKYLTGVTINFDGGYSKYVF